MRAMQPVAHKLFPGAAFGLRDLRFVMRENIVVHAAAVNIELLAENLVAIALHSICQPGRPRPHGLSQRTGPSASSHAFQSAKSPDVFLVSILVVLHPGRWTRTASRLKCARLSVLREIC